MPYVEYIEFNSGDPEASTAFYKEVFGWDPQPFGVDDYFIASSGDEPGIDTGFTVSEDGQPLTVATIGVDDIDGYLAKIIMAGGEIVVPKFAIPSMGWASYFTDPTGMIVGVFQADTEASM